MTNYADIDDLRRRVYFHSATLDNRFKWEKLTPGFGATLRETHPGLTVEQAHELDMIGVTLRPDQDPQWADGLDRYRLVDCAHLEMYRDGKLCTFCGHENYYEPPAQTAARKQRGRRQK